MDNRDLRIFKAVYEERHFGRAGMRLNTVQSNVSARIKRLEEELKTDLFRRSRQAVVPTSAGETLYGYACKLILLEEEARARIMQPDGIAGPLRLGSMETTAAVRLPQMLTRFTRAYPDVDLSLLTSPTDVLVRQVLRQDLDLAFVGGVVNDDKLIQLPVFEEELAIYSRTRQALEEVRETGILVFRQGCAYRRHLEVFLSNRNLFPRRVIEMGTLDGILGCVVSGMGITMMPRSVVGQHRLGADLVEHPLPEGMGRMVTHAVYRKEASNNPVLSAFVNDLSLSAHPEAAA